MIPIRETKLDQFERVGSKEILDSLDGEIRAPIRTILAASWTAADRLRFGVHLVEPFVVPEGKRRTGDPVYARDRDGKVIETFAVVDIPVRAAMTPTEKLERATGLTVAEIKQELGIA